MTHRVPLATLWLLFAPLTYAQQQTVSVTIGHAAPLTGGIAHLGRDNENGARLAVEEINAAGGIVVGDRRYRFLLVPVDDKADPAAAVQVARDLVAARVAAVVGHLNSGTSIPAARVYAEAGVPQISPSATNPRYTAQGLRTTFRLVASDQQQASTLAQFLVKRARLRTTFIVDDGTSYGSGMADDFEAAIQGSGVHVVGRGRIRAKQTADVSTVIARIQAASPDAILLSGMDTEMGPLAAALDRAGIKAQMAGFDGACSPEFIKLAGKASDQYLCSITGEAVEHLKSGSEFARRFKARFAEDVQLYSPYSYDAVVTIADAIRRAGSAEPTALLEALRTTDFRGITGRIRFDARGDIKDGAVSVFEIRDGKLSFVTVIRPQSQ